jgi:hypothetical protein
VGALKVLQLGINVASHMSTTIRGLREIGVEARGIVTLGTSHLHSSAGLEVLTSEAAWITPRWWLDVTPKLHSIAAAIRWADVVHWYVTPGLPRALDLRYAARLGKPSVIEFGGSDIRDPRIESSHNPYYAARGTGYEYAQWESPENSVRVQRLFAAAGAEVIVSEPSLVEHVRGDVFNAVHVIRQRVFTRDFKPAYPDPAAARPVVVHASSAPVAKGTRAVLTAVAALQDRVSFEFVQLERVSRHEALAAMRRADIYLDQFVLGSHGSATIEALSLGKPVVLYLTPRVVARLPPDLPLVNATQESLPEALESLLQDGRRRYELGRAGRSYAERYHDAVVLAHELMEIYTRVVQRKRDDS